MIQTTFLFRFFVVVCLTLTFAAFAVAAPQVYVSYAGSDANSCDRTAPCATFAVAAQQVDAGGEIIALDSGNFGAVTINKAMQIIAPSGVNAGVSGYASPVVVAAGANDKVVLRGLAIKGGTYGVDYVSGGALFIENCAISDAYSRGVRSTAPGKLYVKNSVVRNNFLGIEVFTSNGTAQATISQTTIENNSGIGIFVYTNAKVSVTESSVSGNQDGFSVASNGKLTATDTTAANNSRYGFSVVGGVSAAMVLDDCAATGNDIGIYNGGGGLPTGLYARVSNTTVTNNRYGFYNLGFFESYGNNRVRGNTTNTYGTITVVSQN